MKTRNIAGFALLAVQAVLTIVLAALLITSRLLPAKLLVPGVIVLVLLLAIIFLLARTKGSASRLIGIFLSLFLSGMLFFGILSIRMLNQTFDTISTEETATSEMVVAVRANDPAQSIKETASYTFGTYEQEGSGQISTVLDELTAIFGTKPSTVTYSTPAALANDLLSGSVDALIYNGSYTDILNEAIENYSDQIRILSTSTILLDETESASNGQSAQTSQDTQSNAPLTERSFTVYISGIDVHGPISTTSRSDVNILMTVNPKTGKILLTTTPRDYYVQLPGISGEKRDKLTHAGIYGINTSMETLAQLYNVQIDYYIRINFDSLIKLVDVLGGIDVRSEYSFSAGGYSFVQGTNHLNGEQALAFSRERYSFSSGDNQRGKNQLLVLTGILEKLQSPSILSNATDVLNVVQTSMQTNVPKDEITGFIAYQLAGGPSWSIASQAVTGTGDKNETYSIPGTSLYVMWPDEDSVTQASNKMKELMQQ